MQKRGCEIQSLEGLERVQVGLTNNARHRKAAPGRQVRCATLVASEYSRVLAYRHLFVRHNSYFKAGGTTDFVLAFMFILCNGWRARFSWTIA